MKPFLVAGFICTLAVGSFVVGRIAATRPGTTKATTTMLATDTAAVARPGVAADRAATSGLAQLLRAADPEGSGPGDITFVHAPLEETPEATAARRVETDLLLSKDLGKIPGEQRALLMDLNDRAIEFQRRLTGEFQRGTISHEDYMQRVHEEMLNQLDELKALVSEDQYRILTGLEPGVDPFEFMISGVGGAHTASGEVGGAL